MTTPDPSSDQKSTKPPVKSHGLMVCFLSATGIFLGLWLLPFAAIFGFIGTLISSFASLAMGDPRFFIALTLSVFAFCICAGNRSSATPRQSLVCLVLGGLSLLALMVCLLSLLVYADRTPNRQDYTRLMNTPPANWKPSKFSGSIAFDLQSSGIASVRMLQDDCVEIVNWNVQSKYYQMAINDNPVIEPASCKKGLNTWKWTVIEPGSPSAPHG